MSSSMRDQMPATAAFVDAMREAFGKEMVECQIRRGIKGEPTFFAQENGHQVGTCNTESTSVVYWDEQGISRSRDPGWMIDARKLAVQQGVHIRQHNPDDPMDVQREAQELRDMIAALKGKEK